MPLEIWRENLKAIRKRMAKSQSDIAFQLGRTQQTIANWESGKADPSIDELVKITKFFGIPIGEIFGKIHLTGQPEDSGNSQKSTPKGTPIGTPNPVAEDTTYLDSIIKNLNAVVKAKDEVIASQAMTIAAQKTLLDHVNQQLAKMEQENERLKRAIPELPTGVEGRSVKKKVS